MSEVTQELTARLEDNTPDPSRSPMKTTVPADAPKKRAPRTPKSANPLADAKAEIKMLTAKVAMMDSQLNNSFTRERANVETIDRLQTQLNNANDKLTLTARQIGLVLETIRIGGK